MSAPAAAALCAVAWVLSPCMQPAAAITVAPEAKRDRGVVVFFSPLLLFKAILHSSTVAGWEVEPGRMWGAPVGSVPSLMSSLCSLVREPGAVCDQPWGQLCGHVLPLGEGPCFRWFQGKAA